MKHNAANMSSSIHPRLEVVWGGISDNADLSNFIDIQRLCLYLERYVQKLFLMK